MENDKLKKICIITGGAGGIGYQLSEGFNKKGYKKVLKISLSMNLMML